MAASNRRDLFISVNGSVTGLTATTKAAKSLLHEIGSDAANVLTAVEQKLGAIGAGGLPGLKDAERNFDATFRRIRENARSVLDAPSGQAAIQIVDANAANEAAAAAEHKAAALRIAAEAANRADQAQQGQNAAVRAFAVSLSVAAVEEEQFARALREQAGVLALVDGQLDKSTAAQRRQVAVNGQARAGYQQLSYQLGDVATQYAAGTSATIIFAQQSGQVIQAIQLIAGEAKGFIGFLGGPWGVALSAALVALTPFVGKLLEGEDALAKENERLKENAEKAAIADQAKQAFLRTEAGAIDDVRALTEEIKRQNDALGTNAERLNIRSKLRLETLSDARAEVTGDLAKAREDLAKTPQVADQFGTGSNIRTQAEQQIKSLQTRLDRINTAIAAAEAARLATQKDLASEAAARASDPAAAIKYQYEGRDGLIEQAKKRATAEETVNGTLTRQLTTLKAQQKIDEARAQKKASDAKRTPNNNQIGRQIDVAEATRIAASFGGRVTSGIRSTASQARIYADKLAGRHDGPVAKPGTSDHERGQAIDIAYGPGVSVASIRAAFQKEGVAIRQLIDERSQRVFHVGFGPKGKSQESIDRSGEATEQKRIRDAEAYAGLKTRAQQELLDTTRQQVTSVAQAADLDAQRVVLEQQRLGEAADAGVLEKRWTQAQADQLKAIYQSTAALKVKAIRDAEAEELARRKLEIERADADAAIGLLQQQGDLASTARDRRRIALEIVGHEERIARATLEAAIAAEKDPTRKAELQRRLGEVPTVFDGRRKQAERQTDNPLQAYGRQLIERTNDLDGALQEVKLDGLRSLEDGLLGIVDGTETVASAFKKMATAIIADLARIAIQKAIVGALGSSFFGLAEGGAIGDLPGFAGGGTPGGRISGPGNGTSDSILAILGGGKGAIRVSNGEFIVNERATRDHLPLLHALNSGRLPRFASGGAIDPGRIRLRALPDFSSVQRGGGAPALSISMPIDARGADQAAVARIEAGMAQAKAELPGRVIAAYFDARGRGIIRS